MNAVDIQYVFIYSMHPPFLSKPAAYIPTMQFNCHQIGSEIQVYCSKCKHQCY